MDSSTWKCYTDMGTFSPGGGTISVFTISVVSLDSVSVSITVTVPPSVSPNIYSIGSAFLVSLHHPQRCSALILEGPPKRLDLNLRTNHHISFYIGMESSTWKGYTDMGTFSPGGGTRRYSVTHSSVICSRVTQSGGSERLDAALYQPFIWFHN